MASFKIYGSKESNQVIAKGNFNDFQNYNDLKKKIIDGSQKKKDFRLKESDKFVIKYFFDEKNKDIYYPIDLKEGVFNNKTFNYLKEKLNLHEISKDVKYQFEIEKVEKLPKWSQKQNHEILKESLNMSWEPIHDDIIAGVNLTKLEESKKEYEKKKNLLQKCEKELNREVHKNIICNNCFTKNFKGKRFVCAECNNYNLCQNCEKIYYQKQIHERNHTLIQVNKALNDENEDDIYKYNNIIGNNNQELKGIPLAYQLDIKIINIGDNDLKGCYILPVRFGDEYLTCAPKAIEEEVPRNMSINLGLLIRVPENKGYFEGYFRMFTPHGLPFGEIIFVKVLNGE
jgi:hypothetical protein